MVLIRINFLLLVFILSIFKQSYAQDPVKLVDKRNRLVPIQFYQYNETLGLDANPQKLISAKWTETLVDHQSYISGFWIKFDVQNYTDKTLFGVDHPNRFERMIIEKSINTTQFIRGREHIIDVKRDDTGFTIFENFDKKHFFDNIQFEILPGEKLTIYDFVQSIPYNRWHGLENPVETLSIMYWPELLKENKTRMFILLSFCLFVGGFLIIFIIHVIVDFNWDYIFMMLTALGIGLLWVTTHRIGMGWFIGMPIWTTISEYYVLVLSAAWIAFTQFIYRLINSEGKFHEKWISWFHYGYISIVGFTMVINAMMLINWPQDYVMDLNTYPVQEVGLGPSFIPPLAIVISFAIWLIPMIGVAGFCIYKNHPIAIYALISMLFMLFLPLKYLVIKFLSTGRMFDLALSNEVVLAMMLSMLSFTASTRNKYMKKRYLETQLTLKESYARFVPEELTSQLQKDSILNVELGDQRSMEMAIFFSDIRDFTSMSEKLSPEETFAFVNRYLSQMVPIVKKHKGFVNKFIGDAIMALYPGRNDDAVECAIDMFQALRKFNRQRELEEKAPIRIGIGINTGLMMLGTLGNEDRMEASVISNSVNLASRIEGLTKTYKVPCIISGHTVEKLTPNKYHLRWIDRVQVKGKEEYTEIYELMDCYEENRMIKLQENTPIFLRGIDQWKAGDLKGAGTIFRGLMEDDPDDYVPYIYWNRCKNGERWVEDGLGTRFLDMLRRSSD